MGLQAVPTREREGLGGRGSGRVRGDPDDAGGHGTGDDSVDILIGRDGRRERLVAPRIATQNTHGTGCTLSSAIASGLAHGIALNEAVALAKRYISAAIAASDAVKVGRGHGPVHHFHHWWDRPDGSKP